MTTTNASSATPAGATPAVVTHKRRTPISDILLSVWGWLVMAFLFLPIIAIVVASFNNGRLLTSFQAFGFEAYAAAFASQTILPAVGVSLRVALFAAVVATVLGTLAGVAMARKPGWWLGAFTATLLLATVTPEIVDAVSLLPWFVQLGTDFGMPIFSDGIVRLTIGSSLFATAVVSFLVQSRLVGLDANMEEASADLYASKLTTFTRITMPLAMPAVLSGFMLSFTLALDNTVIAQFISVSGATPWPVLVMSGLRTGLRPEIGAMATLMLVFTLIVLGIVALILRRSGESATDIARTMTGG